MAFQVKSPNVKIQGDSIIAKYNYRSTLVEGTTVTPMEENLVFKTEKTVPKLGVMLVGWGGNNGTTVTGGILANRKKLQWETKEGIHHADYYGSVTQASTVRLGLDRLGQSVHIPFKDMLPMVDPSDVVLGGWDISALALGDAMKRAQVLDFNLQQQLYPEMQNMRPLPSVYCPDFIAANQSERADNLIPGSKQDQIQQIRRDIQEFKSANKLDKVIVLWTANTERMCDVRVGLNDTTANLMDAIARGESEVSPSTMFAVASILEGCSYINGSPQNTFVPGVIELASSQRVFIGGDDFKSGQTKMKSVLVDYLVSAGIKPASIVSYNHLGNNDGRNLSAPQQFESKELSKSNVIDDMVESNRTLYPDGQTPDHCVVIKYVPYVGDSKRAMDEYTSEIFMGGTNTIVMHNTCEDSLLATPLIIDLFVLCEVCERIQVKHEEEDDAAYEGFHSVLSVLSYLLKAPLVPPGTPVVNALAAQRQCIVNIFRACMGLSPDNYMLLEHRLPSKIEQMMTAQADAASISAAAAVGASVGGAKAPFSDTAGDSEEIATLAE